MMFLKTFFRKHGAPSICAAAIYEVVTVATTGSVSNNSAGLQRAKMWVFNLWPVCALLTYLCPGFLRWPQLVKVPERFCMFQNRIVHRLSFPLNLESHVNKAKQLHMFCLESELLLATFPTMALLVTNLYKQTVLCTNSPIFWDLHWQAWACFSCSWCLIYFFLVFYQLLPCLTELRNRIL